MFNIDKSLEKVNSLLDGTWALAIIYIKQPENIYITRHGSPLVLGYNDDLIILKTSSHEAFSNLLLYFI